MNANSKVALVTGCSSGIGLETALKLASDGYRVVATVRDLQRTKALAEQSQKRGLHIDIRECDVRSEESMSTCVTGVLKEYGRIDVLVNNAAFGFFCPLEYAPMTDVRAQMETNYFGLVRMCQLVIPSMRSRASGMIINISSIAGLFAFPVMGYYTASKFAVEGFTEALYSELKELGIRVVLVEPGRYETQFPYNVSWSRVPETDAYFPMMKRLDRRLSAFKIPAPHPSKAANLISRIVKTGRPRLRYLSGIDAHILGFASRFLPRWFCDRAIEILFHTHRLRPFQLKEDSCPQ